MEVIVTTYIVSWLGLFHLIYGISNLLVKGGLIIHLLRTMPLKIDDLEDDAFLLAWHLFRVLCLFQEGITMEFVG